MWWGRAAGGRAGLCRGARGGRTVGALHSSRAATSIYCDACLAGEAQ